jgi:L-lysine 6-oxidase
MTYEYAIHPAIGIARAGNSQADFYLEPVAIGGLPLECDQDGNPIVDPATGQPVPVSRFKDAAGHIKRQAARFTVFRREVNQPGASWQEVALGADGVVGLEWSAHLANKKAAWYQFNELEGDLMFGAENSYAARQVPLNNPTVTGTDQRRQLIIDPGPRHVQQSGERQQFSRFTIPPDYRFGSFPDPNPSQGSTIDTLGEILMDRAGRLLVLGGFGLSGGNQPIDSFGGASTWHDDISDGPVSCRLRIAGQEPLTLSAWVVVGSPKFAPELVNMVTLDDVAFDVAVRYLDLLPALYRDGAFDPSYVAEYGRDIEPILRRPVDNIWVANVPAMAAFSFPQFDTRDSSEANRPHREAYFRAFRREDQHNQLAHDPAGAGLPLMPLNSGSNSVTNVLTDKFLTLTATQHFLLGQWAAGKFTSGGAAEDRLGALHALDRASLGNCVGGPMCPGIEVTWSTRNPAIYARPFVIKPRHDEDWYRQHGLDPSEDECEGGGCEPGDLTKRMAVPWQADFFQCTVQFINYTEPAVNEDDNSIPIPPTYYAYWWPPQSPMYVLAGGTTVAEQAAAGVPAGFQVYYPRGINSFAQMITAWSYLGFVVNEAVGPERRRYPYFVERERNHAQFQVASVAVGDIGNFDNPQDTTFYPIWFLKPEPAAPAAAALALAQALPGVPSTLQRPVRAPARGNRHHGRR